MDTNINPEKTLIDITPAGFIERLMADVLDFILISVPLTFFIFLLTGEYSYEWVMGWLWHVVYTGYLTLLPLIWSGYVVGKRVLKIKVKRLDDKPLTFKNMILREIVGKFAVAYITFGISSIVSIFMVLFRKDKRAVHDFIGGTYVGYEGL
ncbi:RDD family protein [Bacillus sp. FJAT-27445]|uniref:RDD family protein n=1 Tax=Bacillus sp. FJAT-27445 TaxID=1679166 RepID=UPI0020A24379|nr:RDD family protein [Bacillus sp. FJAT-27445]